MDLTTFRQHYPAYADVPDQPLAEALHKKFYSDMPFDDFAGKIGLTLPDPASSPMDVLHGVTTGQDALPASATVPPTPRPAADTGSALVDNMDVMHGAATVETPGQPDSLVARGLRHALAGLYQRLAGGAKIMPGSALDLAAISESPNPEAYEAMHGPLEFKPQADRQVVETLLAKAQEAMPPPIENQGFLSKAAEYGIGGLASVPFQLPWMMAGGPVAGFAADAALGAAPQGAGAAGKAALEGALLGKIMQLTGGLPRLARGGIVGGAQAGIGAADGQPWEDNLAQALGAGAMAGGLGGPGKIGYRDMAAGLRANVKEQLGQPIDRALGAVDRGIETVARPGAGLEPLAGLPEGLAVLGQEQAPGQPPAFWQGYTRDKMGALAQGLQDLAARTQEQRQNAREVLTAPREAFSPRMAQELAQQREMPLALPPGQGFEVQGEPYGNYPLVPAGARGEGFTVRPPTTAEAPPEPRTWTLANGQPFTEKGAQRRLAMLTRGGIEAEIKPTDGGYLLVERKPEAVVREFRPDNPQTAPEGGVPHGQGETQAQGQTGGQGLLEPQAAVAQPAPAAPPPPLPGVAAPSPPAREAAALVGQQPSPGEGTSPAPGSQGAFLDSGSAPAPSSGPAPAQVAGRTLNPAQMPEMVRFAKDLLGGRYPDVVPQVAGNDGTRGAFWPTGEGRIAVHADLPPEQLARTLSHEVGHLIDYLPDKSMERGNAMGRLLSLAKETKDMVPGVAGSNREFTRELWDLSQAWRKMPEGPPSQEYMAYRQSPAELYADFTSALLTDPATARQLAPQFTEAFMQAMHRKPMVEVRYNALQRSLGDPELRFSERSTERQEGYQAGEQVRAQQVQAQEEAKSWRHSAKHLYEGFVDELGPLERLVRSVGGEMDPLHNPVHRARELRRVEGILDGLAHTAEYQVARPLRQSGVPEADFGEYMQLKSVTEGQRAKLGANPGGQVQETAQADLAALEQRLGPEKWAAVRQAEQGVQQARQQMLDVMAQAEAMGANPFNGPLTAAIKNTTWYAKHSVVEHLAEQVAGRRGGPESLGRIAQQQGTFKQIENPLAATLAEYGRMMYVFKRNMAAKSSADFLAQNYPEMITEKAKILEQPPGRDFGAMTYLDNGTPKTVFIPKGIADFFHGDYSTANASLKAWNVLDSAIKSMYVTRNPAFAWSNQWRDLKDAMVRLPGNTLGLLKYLPGGLKDALAYERGQHIPDIWEAQATGALGGSAVWRGGAEKSRLERWLSSHGYGGAEGGAVKKAASWLGAALEAPSIISERTTKLASYRYLKDKFPELNAPEIADLTSRMGGSPDFWARGGNTWWSNKVLMFSNVAIQSMRSEMAAAVRNPAEYMLKRTLVSILPTAMGIMAVGGLFGDDMKRWYQRAGKYLNGDFDTIPLGLDSQGNAVGFFFPKDEVGRVIGRTLWAGFRAMNDKDWEQVVPGILDALSGLAPSVTPSIGTAVDLWKLAAGQNPQDQFRGQPIVPENIQKLGTWAPERWAEIGKYLWSQTGMGMLHHFDRGDKPKIKTDVAEVMGATTLPDQVSKFLKVVHDVPVVGPLAQRAVRSSAQGLNEAARGAITKTQEMEARRSKNVADRVKTAVEAAPGGQPGIGDLVPAYVESRNRGDISPTTKPLAGVMEMQRKAEAWSQNPFVASLARASTAEEKMAVLTKAKELLTPDEFAQLQRRAFGHRTLTPGTYKGAVMGQARQQMGKGN